MTAMMIVAVISTGSSPGKRAGHMLLFAVLDAKKTKQNKKPRAGLGLLSAAATAVLHFFVSRSLSVFHFDRLSEVTAVGQHQNHRHHHQPPPPPPPPPPLYKTQTFFLTHMHVYICLSIYSLGLIPLCFFHL